MKKISTIFSIVLLFSNSIILAAYGFPSPNQPAPTTKSKSSNITIPGDVALTTTGLYGETTAALVAPNTNTTCPQGRTFVSTGQQNGTAPYNPLPNTLLAHDLYGNSSTQDLTSHLPPPSNAMVGTDNQFVHLTDGSLLLIRLGLSWAPISDAAAQKIYNQWQDYTLPIAPYHQKGMRAVAFFWRSSDCGNTWKLLPSLDPATFSIPVGNQTQLGSCAFPQGGRIVDKNIHLTKDTATGYWNVDSLRWVGGFDREEVYVDPGTDTLYMSVRCSYGTALDDHYTGADGDILAHSGNFPLKYPEHKGDTYLVFSSSNQGATWNTSSLQLPTSEPLAITSTGNHVFFFQCSGSKPLLYWTNGKPNATGFGLQGQIDLSTQSLTNNTCNVNYNVLPQGLGNVPLRNAGAISIAGITGSDAVRVAYPIMINNRLLERIVTIKGPFTNTATVNASDATMIGAQDTSSGPNGGHIFYATFIESHVGKTMLYWIETSQNKLFTRAQIVDDTSNVWTNPQDISVDNSGKRRSWDIVGPMGDFAIGDYMKGGFDTRSGMLYFIPQWPEQGNAHYNVVKVSLSPGPDRYNGVWEKTTVPHVSVWGWARSDFDNEAKTLGAQGYHLIEVNAFVVNGNTGWNGVWEKTTVPHVSVWGWARSDFDDNLAQLETQGYQLVRSNAYALS